MLRCLKCSSPQVGRDKFLFEDLTEVIYLCSPYRCRQCGYRFYAYWWKGFGLRRPAVGRSEDSQTGRGAPARDR